MDQAVEQLKEFLRQCIKYRFWISIGVASLFAIIAYFLGSGPVQAKADQQTNTIKQAADGVKQFTLPGVPNDQYKPIVDEKTEVLTTDVNAAWKQLYSRQAGLLTWPKAVEARFHEWGRQWPTNVAEGAVELAKVDYIEAYPEYVDEVYRVLNAFDYETGKGIVAAPPKEILLHPQMFEPTKLPELGTIWASQERLWIQRTVLEVVSQVNKKAKDWDSAIVKQINLLEVGAQVAQDQRSIAKGETLEESEKIKAPGTPDEDTSSSSSSSSSPAGGSMTGMAGMESMQSMMRSRMGGMGMGTAGAGAGATESIFYIKPANDKGQYKILPILLDVLVDQDHIQDLLIEMENSPMSIQVMDFELQRPTARVVKPEKGDMTNFAGGYGGMMGGMGAGMMSMRMGGMGGMAGYGGMMGSMMARMNQQYGMGGLGAGMMSMRMGGMGVGPAAAARKGIDVRSKNRGKERQEETKAVQTSKGPSLFDPYFDIVEVKVYGQARFYNPPPADAATQPSPGETAAKAGETAAPAKSDASSAEPAKTAPAKAEAAKTAPAKAEAAKTAPAKAEPAKTEPAKAEPAKTQPAKAEPAKTAPAKAEPAKTEPAKAEPAKTAPAKGAQPNPAAPKS